MRYLSAYFPREKQVHIRTINVSICQKKYKLYLPFLGANHGFMILCLPNAMVVKIPHDSLPSQADPGLLHLNDPGCGVLHNDKRNIVLRTPLKGCGTVRRYIITS